MKFAKKILMGLLLVSLFVSCLVLSSSAESPSKTVEDYETILEYYSCDVYFVEDFEKYELDPQFDYSDSEIGDLKFHGAASVVSDGTKGEEGYNQYLKILASKPESVTDATGKGGYYRWTKNDDMPKSVVSSFKIKLGDAGADNGSTVSFNLTMSDFYEDVPVLTIDARSAAATKISYVAFDERNVEFVSNVAPATVDIGSWYDVAVVFNTVDATLDLTVSNGAEDIVSVSVPACESAGIDSIRLYTDNIDKAAETATYIDDFKLYEGTVVRDTEDSDNAVADFVIDMDQFANDPKRTLDEKIQMADLYERFFLPAEDAYTPEITLDKYDEVKAIVDNAQAYVNKAKADALIEYCSKIMEQQTCYDKLDYQQNVAKPYYDIFPSAKAEIDALSGMTESYKGDAEKKYADMVLAAKNQYDEATEAIETVKIRSAAFVRQLEKGYDQNSKDYTHMVAQRDALAVLISGVDPAYKYSSATEPLGDPNSVYATAGDALGAYDALVAKINEIDATVNNFIPKVNVLSRVEADAVSEQSPYLTVNFADLYQKFSAVKGLCNEGVVHPLLDSNTYPGLADVVAKFEDYKAYVESREAACNDFVSLVNGASNVGLYHTTEEQLNVAAKYLDSNKEYSLEKHTGVEEAIALYYELRQKLATDLDNSAKYKAAVAAINIEAPYADLRAQVNAALALKEVGAIVGIEGIEEANIALIAAEKKVTVLESNSETLKDCVAKLKESTDLAERRTLIFTANSVKDKSEPAIEGVTAAKTELDAQIAKYDADIAAANAAFGAVVSDIASVSAASCPKADLYKMLDVVKALFK